VFNYGKYKTVDGSSNSGALPIAEDGMQNVWWKFGFGRAKSNQRPEETLRELHM
jgi:hypothetical protein